MFDLIRKILEAIGTYKKVDEFRQPFSDEEIDMFKLRNLLHAQFPDAAIFLSDRIYKLCRLADIHFFLRQDRTNRHQYEWQFYDCDDFSYRLMGQFSIPGWASLAFGIVWTNLHALNCFIGTDRKFYFIEPQRDTVQEKLQSWQGSKVIFICM